MSCFTPNRMYPHTFRDSTWTQEPLSNLLVCIDCRNMFTTRAAKRKLLFQGFTASREIDWDEHPNCQSRRQATCNCMIVPKHGDLAQSFSFHFVMVFPREDKLLSQMLSMGKFTECNYLPKEFLFSRPWLF